MGTKGWNPQKRQNKCRPNTLLAKGNFLGKLPYLANPFTLKPPPHNIEGWLFSSLFLVHAKEGGKGREGVEPFAHWSHFGRGGEGRGVGLATAVEKRGKPCASVAVAAAAAACALCAVATEEERGWWYRWKGGIRSRKGWTNFDGDPPPLLSLANGWKKGRRRRRTKMDTGWTKIIK